MRRPAEDVPAAFAAGAALAGEHATAALIDGLRAGGTNAIVLKGPPTASWLHPGGNRYSSDIDLLVPPHAAEAVDRFLEAQGYARLLPNPDASHATTWVKDGAFAVDVHHTLVGVQADRETVWDVLSSSAEETTIGESRCTVLNTAGRTLNVVLHAAQHGPRDPRVVDDLAALIARDSLRDLADAAELARRLGAESAFVAGLCVDPRGGDLSRRLGLQPVASTEAALRAAGAPEVALGVARLSAAEGTRARVRIVRDEIFPSAAFMRVWRPATRTSRLALVAAYAYRPLWLLARLPRAVRAFLRARRAAGGGIRSDD
jgi:hypothetical protein